MNYPAQKIGAKLYYSKTQRTCTNKSTGLIRISLHSQSPLNWVYAKGSSDTEITKTQVITRKPNLKTIERTQGQINQEGNQVKLAYTLRNGKLN